MCAAEASPRRSDAETTRAILEALRARYDDGSGEWVGWREVWNVDFYSIRCWSAGPGHRRVAHEVKSSRGDFLREIRHPEKRQRALALSHQFFFVTPKGLVDKSEIPDDCGLMVMGDDQRLRIVKQAPVREARALKMRECVYLMKAGQYRDGIMDLRRTLLAQEASIRWLSDQRYEETRRSARARDRLVQLGRHLVVAGSAWRGLWQPASWRPGEEDVEVVVEKVERGIVAIRRLDDGGVDSFVPLDRFLVDFEPV